jgi:hypothetical protein
LIVIVEKVANTRHAIEADALTQDDKPTRALMQEVTCVQPSRMGGRIMLVFEITDPADVDKYKPGETYNLSLEPVG